MGNGLGSETNLEAASSVDGGHCWFGSVRWGGSGEKWECRLWVFLQLDIGCKRDE